MARYVTDGTLRLALGEAGHAVGEQLRRLSRRLDAVEKKGGAVQPVKADDGDGERRALEEAIRGLVARLDAHAVRIEKLEARPAGPRYRGVWNAGTEYLEGDFVTHAGAIWHANVSGTHSRPGTDAHFTLAVKSGQR